MEMNKDEVETYLSRVDLRSPLEEGLNAAVSVMTYNPLGFFADFFVAKELIANFGCARLTATAPRKLVPFVSSAHAASHSALIAPHAESRPT